MNYNLTGAEFSLSSVEPETVYYYLSVTAGNLTVLTALGFNFIVVAWDTPFLFLFLDSS